MATIEQAGRIPGFGAGILDCERTITTAGFNRWLVRKWSSQSGVEVAAIATSSAIAWPEDRSRRTHRSDSTTSVFGSALASVENLAGPTAVRRRSVPLNHSFWVSTGESQESSVNLAISFSKGRQTASISTIP